MLRNLLNAVRFSAVAFVSVSGLLLAQPAGAATLPLLQNTTTNTVLVADDFESPAATANPVAATGSWTIGETLATNIESSTLQAFEGTQSVRIVRPTGPSNARLDGNFTTPASGNTLYAQFMVYVTSPIGLFLPNILLTNTGDTSFVSMTPADSTLGTSVNSIRLTVGAGGSTFYSTSLYSAFQTNKWQKWEIQHNLGSKTATFTIDGVSETFTNSAGTATSGLNKLTFVGSPNGSTTYFVDAALFVAPVLPVPEPSTFALGSIALAGLAWKSRRNRRQQPARA